MKLIASLLCLVAFVSCQYGSEKQEISIGGKSYFVDPYLAQEIGGLPAAQRWERIQRMGSPMQMGQQSLKEVSIGGKSYFVDPVLSQQIGGLPAAQQMERVQRRMGPYSSFEDSEDLKEVSIGGKSYFVNPVLSQQIGGLPAAQQMERIQRRMGPYSSFEDSEDLKEVSIDGKSYFVNPVLSQQIGGLPAAQQLERIQRRMGPYSSFEDSGDLKEVSIGGKSYFVNPILSQQIGGLPAVQQLERIQRMGYQTGTSFPRMVRSMNVPTQNVYNKEFTQQRVLRTPISKTVTVLPNEVTRITRNIKTHMPMVHERIRHHYNVENVNKKNIVHHYVQPVDNKYLGTRKGRSAQLGTKHVLHRNRMFSPLRFATEQGGEVTGNELVDTGFNGISGNFWKVQQAASCDGIAAGQPVRPTAICTCNGQVCDNDNCNDLPFPEDIVC